MSDEQEIEPGDWVERVDMDLDPREVSSVAGPYLTLKIGNLVTDPIEKSLYRVWRKKPEAKPDLESLLRRAFIAGCWTGGGVSDRKFETGFARFLVEVRDEGVEV